jgi:outer membrane protein assembly factor BamD (BamD/ComL family)
MAKIYSMILIIAVCSWASLRCEAQEGERYIYDDDTQKWVSGEAVDAPLEGVAGEAQQMIEAGQYRQAEKMLKEYLKNTATQEEGRAAAMLVYADSAFARDEYGIADERYHKLINEYPNTKEFAIALRRELDIANAWLAGKKKRVLGVLFLNASDEAIEILSMIEQLAGGFRIAEVALWTKADYYYQTGQFELAEMSYRRLAQNYNSPRYNKAAMYWSSASAMAAFPGIAFDDTPLLDAHELYSQYLDKYPQQAQREDIPVILEQIRLKRAQKEYETGRFYKRIRKPDAAAYYFRYVIRTWPDTLFADQATLELQRMGRSIEQES